MTSTASELLVSVVMPAYNVAWCIGRAVDSVLAQDFHRRELIVVNDGSTDGTRALLETYRGAIRVIDQGNRGMSAARNAGIRSALGTYVAFLDADDWWLPCRATPASMRRSRSFCAAKRASAGTWTRCASPRCGRCARTACFCHRGCAAASGAIASPASIPTMQNPRIEQAGSDWPTRTRCAPSCFLRWGGAGCASACCGISC